MTAAVDFTVTDAEKAEIIAASLQRFAAGLHHADAAQLAYEANRLEDLQLVHASPVTIQMQAYVAAEQDLRRAHQLLAELGDSADAIADRLRALGIKGAQCYSGYCPLAIYLENNGITAYISREEISVAVTADVLVRMDVPPPVATFIKHFDNGIHLDLIDPKLTDLVNDRVLP